MKQTDFDVMVSEAFEKEETLDAATELPQPEKPISKAWATRRANKAKKLAEAAKVVPVTAGITAEDARELHCLAQRMFEAREALSAAQDECTNAELCFDAKLQSVTVK
jgi:hypothetical protein